MPNAALPADTTLEAARAQLAALKRLSPGRRMQLAMDLSDSVRALAEAGVQRAHPQYDQRRARLALVRVTLGAQLFNEIFGKVSF